MKLRKIAAIAVTGLMVFSMAACGGSSTGSTEAPKTETKAAAEAAAPAAEAAGSGSIGLSISTLNNPFFVTLSDGATAKAGELGLELITVDAGDDSAKQTSDIEDLISKNISVLIVNPVDSDAVAPAVEDAIAKGIKVIAVDRVVNGVEVDCSIASDNVPSTLWSWPARRQRLQNLRASTAPARPSTEAKASTPWQTRSWTSSQARLRTSTAQRA